MAADSEFLFTFGTWQVTDAMRESFERDGYIIVRELYSYQEIAKVRAALEDPRGVKQYKIKRPDGQNRINRMILWNHPGRDVTGVMARCERLVDTAEWIMGGDEMYHYHSKLIMKDAKRGGTFCWHQDYGYWQKNGCEKPDMLSVFIPVDDTDKANGCLQVLRGSHTLGRVNHIRTGEQLGASPEIVEKAKEQFEHVYVEMKAGDALFFHCNLLHTSSANTSDRRRWAFIVAFNKRSNNPTKEHHHACYTPLVKVPDDALLECDEVEDLEGKWFMGSSEDTSTYPDNVH